MAGLFGGPDDQGLYGKLAALPPTTWSDVGDALLGVQRDANGNAVGVQPFGWQHIAAAAPRALNAYANWWNHGGISQYLPGELHRDSPPTAQDIAMMWGPADMGAVMGAIKAYHGSPYDFNKFDLSKIGTGEGAQAYGHGLYFAGNEDVARAYRNALTGRNPNNISGIGRAQYAVNGIPAPEGQSGHAALDTAQDIDILLGTMAHSPNSDMIPYLHEKIQRRIANNPTMTSGGSAGDDMRALADYYQTHVQNAKPEQVAVHAPGKMYEVSIDADPSQLLDWDKPLGEQPKQIRDMLTPQQPMSDSDLLRNFLGSDYARSFPNASDVRTARRIFDRPNYPEEIADWAARQNSNKSSAFNLLGPVGTMPQTSTGGQVYSRIGAQFPGDPAQSAVRASQALNQAGIPGIQYLDQGSRNVQLLPPSQTVHGQWVVKQIPNGNVFYRGPDEAAARAAYENGPSRNYVIFNPDLITILRKYGLVAAPLGAAPFFGNNQTQQ